MAEIINIVEIIKMIFIGVKTVASRGITPPSISVIGPSVATNSGIVAEIPPAQTIQEE